MTDSATGSAAAAEQILTKAGYTKGSNGFFEKGGKTVALTIVDPAAYTDYAEDDAIVAGELRAAGIDATFDGLAVTAWDTDVADGDFQLTEHWSNGGLTPYNMYDGWLDSALASGTAATGDYERLNDPAINADLATLAGASTTAQQTTDLVPIETYVADEPAGHPDHNRVGVVRVQLAELHRLADPGEPVRDRPALRDQQRRRRRHRRSGHPAPDPAELSPPLADNNKRARLARSLRIWGGPHPKHHINPASTKEP